MNHLLAFFTRANHTGKALMPLALFIASHVFGAAPKDPTIEFDHNSFIINGEDTFIYSGSMHYFRCPPSLWEDRLTKIKQAGFNTIECYIPWNYHERVQGEADFSELEAYIKLCERLGLYFTVRIGPFICGEWDHGGYPDWLIQEGIRNSSLRSNEPSYVAHVHRWYEQVVPVIKQHLVTNGGNVILVQVENEFGGGAYFKREVLRDRYNKARALGIDVPIVTCNTPYAWDNTDSEMAAIINGNNSSFVRWSNITLLEERVSEARREERNAPTIILEMPGGQGMHSNFVSYESPELDHRDFVVASKTALMEGAGLTNYYMLYGGTNLGYWGASYQSSSYSNKPSVQCPIDEPGGLTPSYYSVKLTGQWLNEFGDQLVNSKTRPHATKVVKGAGNKPPKIVQKVTDTMAFLFVREEADKTQKIRFSYTDPDNEKPLTIPQNGYLELQPRDMKILVANIPLGNRTVMKYSTSEILDISQVGSRTVVVVYGPAGTSGETALSFKQKPTNISNSRYQWNEKERLLTLNYVHTTTDTSIVMDDIQLVVINKERAKSSWSASSESRSLTMVSDAYLLRGHILDANQSILDVETKPGTNRFSLALSSSPTAVYSSNRPVPYSWDKDGKLLSFKLKTPSVPDVEIEFKKARFSTDSIDENAPVLVKDLQPLELMGIFDKGYIGYSAHFEAQDAESMTVRFYEGSAKSNRSRQTVGDPAMVFVNGTYIPQASGWHPRKINFAVREFLKPGQNKVEIFMEKIGRPCGAGGWGMGEPKGLAAVSLLGGDDHPWEKNVSDWKLSVGTQGQNQGYFSPDFDDSKWQTVQLGDWKKANDTASYDGIGWYRMSFDLTRPEGWIIPVKLQLEAETDALIYLNGHLIGRYNGIGWQREFYLHESYLNEQGENVLAIAVRNAGGQGGLIQAKIVPYKEYSVKSNQLALTF